MFDITILGAIFAGLLSFLSPCILPIVPFYLSYLAGVGMNQISATGVIPGHIRLRAVLAAVCFALGVITIFVGLGATATAFGNAVREYFDILRWGAAAVVLAMGLHFLGLLKIGVLYRQFRADTGSTDNLSLVGAYTIGLAFAFGWTPCVGPVLAAILFTAAGQDSAGEGALLLMAYGIGMTSPFVLAALFVGPFMRWMVRFRPYLGLVEKLMGAFLVLFAALIATNSVSLIAEWLLINVPWFSTLG
ncbi:MAG: cytochrome C biogenesis protein CcdA [Alphaproteobacteria bacterium MedPE-SWcel]|nr:MAG: cytochrome C biogenesis protein CcdA [Alphaproteobacteria bacterium MedPE-SWcel]